MRNLVHLSLVFLFFLTTGTGASFANEMYNGLSSSGEGKPCNEPAPVNYHVEEVFTDGVIVDWDDPVNMPAEYNIKVFEVASGNLIHNANVAGSFSSARVLNLQSNTEYRIRTTPVCTDGTLSEEFSEAQFLTLILDLVVSGFTAATPPAFCTMNAANQSCYINPPTGNVVTFEVSTNAGSRVFGIYRSSNGCGSGANYQFKFRPARYNDDTSFQFFCDNATSANCAGQFVTITRLGAVVARLKIGATANPGINIITTFINTNQSTQIRGLGTNTGAFDPEGNGCGERSNVTLSNNLILTASPNPFHQTLEIQVPIATNNLETEISLFDLHGRRILTQRYPAEQTTITLQTESLTPGMYFLRAESGGISETVKVVKTQ